MSSTSAAKGKRLHIPKMKTADILGGVTLTLEMLEKFSDMIPVPVAGPIVCSALGLANTMEVR